MLGQAPWWEGGREDGYGFLNRPDTGSCGEASAMCTAGLKNEDYLDDPRVLVEK